MSSPVPDMSSMNEEELMSYYSSLPDPDVHKADKDAFVRRSGRSRKVQDRFTEAAADRTPKNLMQTASSIMSNVALPIAPTTPQSTVLDSRREAKTAAAKPKVAPSAAKRKPGVKRQRLTDPFGSPGSSGGGSSSASPTSPLFSTFQAGEPDQNTVLESPFKKAHLGAEDEATTADLEPDKDDAHDSDFAPVEVSDEADTPTKRKLSGDHKVMLGNPLPSQVFPAISMISVAPVMDVVKSASRKRASPRTPKVPKVSIAPVVDTRPESYGQPLVWAEGRQALCETLPYYRAYNSGAYTSEGYAHGFLLDKDCGQRPFMDEEVVITRAGGACARNESGQMEQSSNQSSEDKAIESFRQNKKFNCPLILIVGNENQNCPSRIPHMYCVMDYFQVTNIWAEKTNGVVCFKYRLEKLDLRSKSWWAAKGSPDTVAEPNYRVKATRKTCTSCDIQSVQVFQQGWLCLNEKCSLFWTIDGAEPSSDLTYNARFLEERTEFPSHIKPAYRLQPEILEENVGNDPTYAFDRFGWKGMACPICGRCNSRAHWDNWRCQTAGCGFTHQVNQPILSTRQVIGGGHFVEATGHAIPYDSWDPRVTARDPAFQGNWRIHTYDLIPGNSVTHFFANKSINAVKGGPNDMFAALQVENCMELQRFPGMSTLRGPSLAQHFSRNYGMHYKYVVASGSKSFKDAPATVISALHRLNWAGEKTDETGQFKMFNELLAVGYFEGSKMDYHDDGEKELGPTIATLSLGGPAVMTMRMKERYWKGFTKSLNYNPHEPVLPGAALEDERRELNALYGTISAEEFDQRQKAIYKKGLATLRKKAPVLLKMPLDHGSIVVMHGAEMQKYYEHAVKPTGKLRFALTCRYIRPELVPTEHHWKAEYDPNVAERYYGDGIAADVTMEDTAGTAVQ